MNPEGVPLQERRYKGYPGQPGVTTAVQFTTVNIVTEPPKDHIIWSICCFIYSNPFCCFGLVALIYSIKSRDRKMAGDLEGARKYGATARNVNIMATVMVGVLLLIPFLMIVRLQYNRHY